MAWDFNVSYVGLIAGCSNNVQLAHVEDEVPLHKIDGLIRKERKI